MNKILTILAFIFSIITGMAQDFQGKAFYKSKIKMTIKIDKTKGGSEHQELVKELLKNQLEEYVLTFDKEQSIYKEQESLGGIQQGGIQIIMPGNGSNKLYRNTKDERFVNQKELFGKPFLVKDKAIREEWVLENETKKIGDYTCYKAIRTYEVTGHKNIMIDGDKKQPESKKTVTIVAWYTPEIPVAHGPSKYWGLPGLILEVNNGSQVIICDKIILGTKEKIDLKEPTTGKVVTAEEYEKILMKKIKQVNKNYHGGRKRGNKETIHIEIGG